MWPKSIALAFELSFCTVRLQLDHPKPLADDLPPKVSIFLAI